MAHDVLDLHDRVIHQHARHQTERQQRQEIEVEPQKIHEPEGGDGGQRDGQRGNQRGPPVAQEQEHHDHGQHGPFDHRMDRAFILILGVADGGEELHHPDARIFLLDLFDLLQGIVIHRHVGRAARAGNGEVHHFLAAQLTDRAAFRIAVRYLCDIGQGDDAAIAERNAGFGQGKGIVRIAQHAHRLARSGDLGAPAGGIDIGLAQRRVDLRCRDAERLHAGQIEHHTDFAIDSAETVDFGHAVDREQPFGHRIVDEPAELFQRHVIGLHRKNAQRAAAGHVHLGHPRLDDAIRQLAANLVDRVADLVHRLVGIDADLEFDEGVAVALRRGGIDVLHTIDVAHRRFDDLRHLILDLGRRGAGLRDVDDHGGKFDVRLIDDVHPREAQNPRDHQPQEQNDRDDRVADRPGGDVAKIHGVIPLQPRWTQARCLWPSGARCPSGGAAAPLRRDSGSRRHRPPPVPGQTGRWRSSAPHR